jgi:hypothetical protein
MNDKQQKKAIELLKAIINLYEPQPKSSGNRYLINQAKILIEEVKANENSNS